MALIKCTECGHMISDKASRCPKCGSPIFKEGETQYNAKVNQPPVYHDDGNKGKNKWLYAVIALLLAAIVGGGYYFYDLNKQTEKEYQQKNISDSVADNSISMIEEEYQDEIEQAQLEEQEEQKEQQVKSEKEVASNEEQKHEGSIKATLTGEISTIQNVKMVLRGNTGTLSYIMDGKRIVSNIQLDYNASQIDEEGFGHLVLKSFTPEGKLKGRFIGEMDVAECGYFYQGQFVNVNGGSTTFLLTE